MNIPQTLRDALGFGDLGPVDLWATRRVTTMPGTLIKNYGWHATDLSKIKPELRDIVANMDVREVTAIHGMSILSKQAELLAAAEKIAEEELNAQTELEF